MQPQPNYKTINFPNLGSLNKKFSSSLADFAWLKGGGYVNPLKNENLLFSGHAGLGPKKL